MSRLASAMTWLRGDRRFVQAALPPSSTADGKVADLTGPGRTDRWGVTSTDLGAAVTAPDLVTPARVRPDGTGGTGDVLHGEGPLECRLQQRGQQRQLCAGQNVGHQRVTFRTGSCGPQAGSAGAGS